MGKRLCVGAWPGALALAAIGLLALDVSATSGQAQPPATQVAPDGAAAGGAQAAKIARDKDTGELRAPTAEENAYFEKELKKLRASGMPHQVKQRADGTLTRVVAPEFLALSVVRRTADGKVAMECTDSAHAASDATHTHARPARPLPVEEK